MSGVYGSVRQPKATRKPCLWTSDQVSRVRLQAVLVISCVYQELKTDKSKHKNNNITICIVLSGAPVSYNMYIYI